MYHRVFVESPEGAIVLEDLVARFFDIEVYQAGGIEAQRETERRAARREVLRFILNKVAQVNEAPPDDQDNPTTAA